MTAIEQIHQQFQKMVVAAAAHDDDADDTLALYTQQTTDWEQREMPQRRWQRRAGSGEV